jgi:hypothetical protein
MTTEQLEAMATELCVCLKIHPDSLCDDKSTPALDALLRFGITAYDAGVEAAAIEDETAAELGLVRVSVPARIRWLKLGSKS